MDLKSQDRRWSNHWDYHYHFQKNEEIDSMPLEKIQEAVQQENYRKNNSFYNKHNVKDIQESKSFALAAKLQSLSAPQIETYLPESDIQDTESQKFQANSNCKFVQTPC